MRELAGRLAALDPDAGAALQVIAYFDRLVEERAGLETIVRGAAVLAGCPVRLVDDDRRVRIRVGPDGRRQDRDGVPDVGWLHEPIVPAGPAALWLERTGPAGPVESMVLERAAGAARAALDRTRGRAPADDPALVELLLDPSAPEPARLRAARRLGLPTTGRVRAVAFEGGGAGVVSEGKPVPGDRVPGDRRAGIGPAVPVLDLPASWTAARTALRFTAAGSEQDPGPRVVAADSLGGLAVLALAVGPGTEPVPDVHALEHAGSAAPWALATLYAVANSASLRTAAASLNLHHSTLADRLGHAERLLGWSVRDPAGRLRLQLAFALRSLHRHPVT
nr:helix-turn-helix domain-containing protein [Micromonospora sp. DSM 115978]